MAAAPTSPTHTFDKVLAKYPGTGNIGAITALAPVPKDYVCVHSAISGTPDPFGQVDAFAARKEGILYMVMSVAGHTIFGHVGPETCGPFYCHTQNVAFLGQFATGSKSLSVALDSVWPGAASAAGGWNWSTLALYKPIKDQKLLYGKNGKFDYSSTVPQDELPLLESPVICTEGVTVDVFCTPSTMEAVTAARRLTSGKAERIVLNCSANCELDNDVPLGHIPDNTSIHTVVVIGSPSTKLICNIIDAKCPWLLCVILEECTNIVQAEVLKSAHGNPHLEELAFNTSNNNIIGGAEASLLARQCCPRLALDLKPDHTVPPPKIAQQRATILANLPELQSPVTKHAFEQMYKKDNTLIGLVTPHGEVVPLSSGFPMHCCLLLLDVLKDAASSSGDDEKLIPMEMDPPVSKAAIALAIHFVSFYVNEATHKECERKEKERVNSGLTQAEQVAKGIKELEVAKKIRLRDAPQNNLCQWHWCDICDGDKKARKLHPSNWYRVNEDPDYDVCSNCLLNFGADYSETNSAHSFTYMANVMPSQGPLPPGPEQQHHTYTPAFNDFHTRKLQELYPSPQRRIKILCELLAVAAFLNIPTLKRFVRAALTIEDHGQSSESCCIAAE